MDICRTWPARQHWAPLGSPQSSSDPNREHWPEGTGSQRTREHTSARSEQRRGPRGVSPRAWMSQINNIFRSCLYNYTRSFFQGSSRPPHSLIASASSSHRHWGAVHPAVRGFHGDGAARRGAGEGCQQSSRTWPKHRWPLGSSRHMHKQGQQGRMRDRPGGGGMTGCRYRTENKWRWQRETFKIGKCLWIRCTVSTKKKNVKIASSSFFLKTMYVCMCVYIHTKWHMHVHAYIKKSFICPLLTSGNRISRKVNFHGNTEKQQDRFGLCYHFIWAHYHNIYSQPWFMPYSGPLMRLWHLLFSYFYTKSSVFILCTRIPQQGLFYQ